MPSRKTSQGRYQPTIYRIQQWFPEERCAVESRLRVLERLAPEWGDRVITAWVSFWRSSPHADLDRAPM